MTTDTQAAVAAALMQAAETIRENETPCIPCYPDGWTGEQIQHYNAGQMDAAASFQSAILALIPAEAMAALEAVKAEARKEAEKEILQAAGDEYALEHQSEGSDQRFGRKAAVRGMMVRLGLYDKLEAAIDAAMEGGKP